MAARAQPAETGHREALSKTAPTMEAVEEVIQAGSGGGGPSGTACLRSDSLSLDVSTAWERKEAL